MEYNSEDDANCGRCTLDSRQRIGKGIGSLGNKSTSGDHPDYSIIKIDKNTEKGPGDLRRLVTQTFSEYWCTANTDVKNSRGVNNNNDNNNNFNFFFFFFYNFFFIVTRCL